MTRARRIAIWTGVALLLAAVAWAGLTLTVSAVAEVKVKEFFAGMQDVVRAEYGTVRVNPLTLSATIDDLRMEVVGGVRLSVDEFTLSRYEVQGGLPRAVSVRCEGVRIPLGSGPLAGFAPGLLAMGYDVLALDYAMDFDYDPGSRRFCLDDLRLKVRDAGELGMRLKLGNVDLGALLKGGPGALFFAVERGELRYVDDSFFRRVLEVLARDEDAEPGEVAETLVQGLSQRRDDAEKLGDAVSARAFGTLASFVRQPSALTVRVEPAEPVALVRLTAMRDPAEVLRALNLSVRTDEEN
jgi:hypothetical protein